MTTYNLGWTLEAYSGCLMGDSKDATSVTPVDVTQTHEPVVHDQATPGQGWFWSTTQVKVQVSRRYEFWVCVRIMQIMPVYECYYLIHI